MIKKILSYNVNGLRAASNKGLFDWLRTENPDIICIQEIKLQKGQFDVKIIESLGYHHYWHYALKKGYSGVAIFSKDKPIEIIEGIGMPEYDNEGRFIMAKYEKFGLISTYFPSGTTGDIRQTFKMRWLDDFLTYVSKIRNSHDKIIISGDYNICHKPIDINHPERHETYSGFLPEERAWMDKFVAQGFVDSFRIFNQNPDQYSWWSYRAGTREKNLGWRIDYHIVTESMKPMLKSASILNQAHHSDHCPVSVEIDV